MTEGMGKRNRLFAMMLLVMVLTLLGGCNYGRMYDQDSEKTYEKKMEVIDQRSVPTSDGYDFLASVDPADLKSPLPPSPPVVEQGRLSYGYYCSHCHGPKLDGNGTVGQSFSPLPTNLRSPAVLSLDDGVIYARMLLGYKRHPRLFSTVAAEDGWAIIAYIRSGKEGQP